MLPAYHCWSSLCLTAGIPNSVQSVADSMTTADSTNSGHYQDYLPVSFCSPAADAEPDPSGNM